MPRPFRLLSIVKTTLCLSLSSSVILAQLPVLAKDKPAQSLPPLAPEIKREASAPTNGVNQADSELPAPSAAPEGEMPAVAPELNRLRIPDKLPSSSSGNFFDLHAQQIDVQAQRNDLRIGRPADGAYDRSPAPLNGILNDQTLTGNAFNQPPPALQAQADRGGSLTGHTLTQVDLQKLAAHDVVLLIDRSASMASMDCPNGSIGKSVGLLPSLLGIPFASTSRWNWCLQQTSELSRQTQNIYDRGITVVLFSSGFMSFPNVTMDRLPQIFQQNSPAGGTNLAQPLAVEIGEYLKRREYTRGNAKPVMIGVITDGCPNNRQAVREAIIEATQLMKRPDEITIIFFLIGGMDFMGERFVNELVNNLPNQGARFPIVKEVSFGELQQVGLAKAIAQNLR